LHLTINKIKGRSIVPNITTEFRGERVRTDYPEEELFATAQNNPAAFADRLGFEEPNMEYRRQILLLKDQLELSDEHIRILKSTGDLYIGKLGYGVIAERWAWWAGWSLAVIMSFLLVLTVFDILVRSEGATQIVSGLAIIAVPFYLLLRLNHHFLIKSCSILRSKGCKLDQWYTSN
jgi:hypothetical protein